MARRRSRNAVSSVDLDPLIRLWLLRVLVPLGGHRDFVRPHGISNDSIAAAIGL